FAEMMSMQPVEHIAIPAQGMTALKPGGFHIMLINVKKPPRAGENVYLTLTFQRAGKVQVMVPIQDGHAQHIQPGHHMQHGDQTQHRHK
ncbi:MAG: hypothetical protein ETSY1_41620, partial [Candidatus Entotheonella factor]